MTDNGKRSSGRYVSLGAVAVLWAMALVHHLWGQLASIVFGAAGIVAILAHANWTSVDRVGLARFAALIAGLVVFAGVLSGAMMLIDRFDMPTWPQIGLILLGGGSIAYVGVRVLVWLSRPDSGSAGRDG